MSSGPASEKARRLTAWIKSSDAALIWKPFIKHLFGASISITLFMTFAVLLAVHVLSHNFTSIEASLFSWQIEGVAEEDIITSGIVRQREPYTVAIAVFSRIQLIKLVVSLAIKVAILIIGISLASALIRMTSDTVLLFIHGVKPMQSFGSRSKLHKFETAMIAFGAILLATALVFLAFRYSNQKRLSNLSKEMNLWLWCVSSAFFLWYAFKSMETYRRFQASRGTHRYMFVRGASGALAFIISVWALMYSIDILLPRYVDEEINMRCLLIQEHAVEQADSTLHPSDRSHAIGAVSEGLSPLRSSSEKAKELLKTNKQQAVLITLLACYVFMAAPFCAVRYPNRSHLMFWVCGSILGAVGYGFKFVLREIYGDTSNSEVAQFLLALAGVAVGFYLGLLLAPLHTKRPGSSK